MNNFIGWKFGVPVKVKGMFPDSVAASMEEALLFFENLNGFRVINDKGHSCYYDKETHYFELILYRNYGSEPRYPVCVNKEKIVHCNAWGKFSVLSQALTKGLVRIPEKATLTIDGKTIELSRETIDRLKKELGV